VLQALSLVALSGLLAGSFFVVPYLPTNDGPEWVFAAHIENHYSDPATPYYAERYVPALQFASRGFLFLYGPLEAWLGWQRGLQLALAVVALVLAWGFVALVRALAPERLPVGLLGFPLALSWTLYMGFWSYTVALGAGLLVLAFAARAAEPGAPGLTAMSGVVLAGGLLLTAVAHVFAAAVIGLALAALLVASAPRGRRLVECVKVGLLAVPSCALALASIAVSREGARDLAMADRTYWYGAAETLRLLPQTLMPGPLGRALVATALITAAALHAVVRARRSETSGPDRGLLLVAILCLAATLVLPVGVPGWQFLAQRFATPGAVLAVAVLPFERLSPRSRRVAAGVMFAASAASLIASYGVHQRLAALSADAVAGVFAPLSTTGQRLPVALSAYDRPPPDGAQDEVPMLDPLLHIGALYAAAHGGLIPYVFASSSAIHPFVLRRDAARALPIPDVEYYWGATRSAQFEADRTFRHVVEEDLAAYGMLYDAVVVVGARDDDVALWRSRGYVPDWERETAFVAHFESRAGWTSPCLPTWRRWTPSSTWGGVE
jgi:hypothetical protein